MSQIQIWHLAASLEAVASLVALPTGKVVPYFVISRLDVVVIAITKHVRLTNAISGIIYLSLRPPRIHKRKIPSFVNIGVHQHGRRSSADG